MIKFTKALYTQFYKRVFLKICRTLESTRTSILKGNDFFKDFDIRTDNLRVGIFFWKLPLNRNKWYNSEILKNMSILDSQIFS